MAKFLLTVVVVAAVAVVGGGWYFSNELITQDRKPLELAGDELPAEPVAVEFVSDGLEIEGWYFEGGNDCGLLFLHGRGENREQALAWRVPFDEYDCHHVLIDHRAHGESDGAFHTYGVHERGDAALALDWLAQRTGLGDEDLGVVGISYGAATALQMLPDHQDLAFVLADSPYASLRSVAEYQAVEQFDDWVLALFEPAVIVSQFRADFDVDDAAPERTVVGSEVPVLLVHDVDDPYTPYANALAIDAADPDDPLVLVPFEGDADHHQMVRTQTERYTQVVADFLGEYAPAFGS